MLKKEVKHLRNNDIKEFLSQLSQNEKLKEEISILAKQQNIENPNKISNHILKDIILAEAKKEGYDFEEKELLNYATEKFSKLTPDQLENISAGGFLSWLTIFLAGFAAVGGQPMLTNLPNGPATSQSAIANFANVPYGQVAPANTFSTATYGQVALANTFPLDLYNKATSVSPLSNELIGLTPVLMQKIEEESHIKQLVSQGYKTITGPKTTVLTFENILKFLEANPRAKKIIIPKGVKKIDADTFRDWKNLKEVYFSDGIEEIDNNAFAGCDNLKKVDFPNSLKKIGSEAFRGTALKEIAIREGVTEIGDRAFSLCRNLKEVTLPQSLEKIGSQAFLGTALKEIAIPEGVTEIGDYAFSNCYKLKKVTLPSHLSLEILAFHNNPVLKEIWLGAECVDFNTLVNNGLSHYLRELAQMRSGGNLAFSEDQLELFEKCFTFELENAQKKSLFLLMDTANVHPVILDAEKKGISVEEAERERGYGLGVAKFVSIMDKYMEERPGLPASFTAFRGLMDGDFVNEFCKSLLDKASDIIDPQTISEVKQKIDNDGVANTLRSLSPEIKRKILDKKLTYQNSLYTCVSLDESFARKNYSASGIMLRVHMPEGTKFVVSYDNQRELRMPRGTMFMIKDIDTSGEKVFIDVEIIPNSTGILKQSEGK